MSNVTHAPQPRDNALLEFHGRNFARFGLSNKIHCRPVDHLEEYNFDYLDEIFEELLGRRILPSLNLDLVDEPAILDCGYGTGAWIDRVLAGCHSDILAVGIDIFTGRGNGDESDEDADDDDDEEGIVEFVKKRRNLNASFRTWRDEYVKPESFDLINSRFLTDGLDAERWDTYVKELKDLLVPGGWLQMVEVHLLFQSDNGRDTSHLDLWWQWYERALQMMNKRPRIARQLGDLMRDAAFARIQYNVVRLPIGPWIEGQEALGNKVLTLVSDMIGSSSIWPFLRICEMPVQQYTALIEAARQVLRQPGMQLYLNAHVACGCRPPRRR